MSARWYSGKVRSRAGSLNALARQLGLNSRYEAFKSEKEPTEESHGDKYLLVVGPFRTKRGAVAWSGLPFLITQDQAERLALAIAEKKSW